MKGSKVGPAVENLEKVLASRQTEVRAFFDKLIQ